MLGGPTGGRKGDAVVASGVTGPYSVTSLCTLIRSGYWGASVPEAQRGLRVAVIRNGDLHRSGALTGAAERYFSAQELERARVAVHDILFTANGEIGKVHLVQQDRTNLCVSNFVRKITPNPDRVDPRWLYYSLQLPEVANLIDRHAGGSTIKNLRRSFFEEPWLFLPPLSEQSDLVDDLEAGLTRLRAAETYINQVRQRAAVLRSRLLVTQLKPQVNGEEV